MRRLRAALLVALWCYLSVELLAAFAVIASASAGSTDTNTVTTGTFDSTGGDFLALCDASTTGSPTISDSKTNTWTALTNTANPTLGRSQMHYAKNATVGTGHTATNANSANEPAVAVLALSGSHLTAPADQESAGGVAEPGTTVQPGSITPSENDTIVVTCLTFWGAAATASIDSGFTVATQANYSSNNAGVALAYLIQTTATAVNPTWTVTVGNYLSTRSASFKIAGGGGGGGPRPVVIGGGVF